MRNRLNLINLPVIIIFLIVFSDKGWPEGKARVFQGKKIYTHYCTPCHGIKGDGKGFNAKNLDPRPANHTDTTLMNRRTDKDLYDVIEGGGRGVGKSTLMPPWGNTFTDIQIDSLILYLRKLCKCQRL